MTRKYSKLEVLQGFQKIYNAYESTISSYSSGLVSSDRYNQMIAVCNRMKSCWERMWLKRFERIAEGQYFIEDLSMTLVALVVDYERNCTNATSILVEDN